MENVKYLFSDREVVFTTCALEGVPLSCNTPLQALAYWRKEDNTHRIKVLENAFKKMPNCSDMEIRPFILKMKEATV